jgi:hypothetical protein
MRHIGGTLFFHLLDHLDNFDTWNATAVPLLVGVPNRIMVRWRGSDHTVKMQIGEQDAAVTPSSLPHAVTITAPDPGGPIEIGAISNLDFLPVVACYAEVAIWTHFKSDADALKYGQGWAPSLLDTVGRVSYMTLLNRTTGLVDQWRSFTATLGEPTNTEDCAHPSVFYEPPSTGHLVEDLPSLPVAGFDPYELEGHGGQRSGVVWQVPSAQAPTLQVAMASAQYGDDILLDPSVVVASTITIPAKAITTSTPRMPPTGRTALTGATSLTG